jgi:DNA helicase II / ATP-dependent DNA helicase PcrA
LVLAEAYNRVANVAVSADQVMADAESSGRSYFATWLDEARKQASGSPRAALLELVAALATDPSSVRNVIDKLVANRRGAAR